MKKDIFFEKLKNRRLYNAEKIYKIASGLLFANLFVTYIFTCLTIWLKTDGLVTCSSISIMVLAVLFIIFLAVAFYRNMLLFKNGIISKGIGILILAVILVIGMFVWSFVGDGSEDIKNTLKILITPTMTMISAIIAAIGVHYTLSSSKSEKICEKNIVLKMIPDGDNIIDLKMKSDDSKQYIAFENISSNLGYFIGVYKYCEGEVKKIGFDIGHYPIEPNCKYKIVNINTKPEDETFWVYKDIYMNYYYVHFEILNLKNEVKFKILNIDNCDFDYLNEMLSDAVENGEKDKSSKEQKSNKDLEKKNTKLTKENTIPQNIIRHKGFDVIADENGEILTDMNLLFELKELRLKISKENKYSAFIIFSNTQLVSLATYKPQDEKDFISIYGLGSQKYQQYGKQFIEIIKKHL